MTSIKDEKVLLFPYMRNIRNSRHLGFSIEKKTVKFIFQLKMEHLGTPYATVFKIIKNKSTKS
jgi:hypothetical protein